MDMEDRLVCAMGEGEEVGWIGSLGLVDEVLKNFNTFIISKRF